jgi:hypothetical protein
VKKVLGVEVKPTVVEEPVLDVPAVDMTDPVVPSRKAPARRKRIKRSVPGRRQPSQPTQVKVQATRTRDGSVGRDTFERVEALLRQDKNKTEAFKQVADDTGKNSGTVAANYYRVARSSGAVKPRRGRAKAAPATAMRARQKATQNVSRRGRASSGNGAVSIDRIVEQLVASVAALTEAVKAQDAEVRELRGRLDGMQPPLR